MTADLKPKSLDKESLARYDLAVNNIVTNCMRLKPNDRLVIVTDEPRLDIGSAIENGAQKVCATKLFKIEDFVQRPAITFPEEFQKAITDFHPTASIYAATGQPGELQGFRFKLMNQLTKDLNCRHGHMISIDEQIMLDGMSKDYAAIGKACQALGKVLKPANEILITDPHGTSLTVTFSHEPGRKWKIDDGILTKPHDWGNLPAGEVFTCPKEANGQVVAWEIGDYFSDKYGLLEKPIILTVQHSRVTNVSGENTEINKELLTYLRQQPNGDRMGEFANGCLLGLPKLIGNLLQDEKFPGVHMAFGHPYPDETGQKDWDADTHVDVIPLKVNEWVDGRQVLKEGQFIIDLQ